MLERLTINLSQLERQALEKIATVELRDLRDQARFILRQEFERRGFLTVKHPFSVMHVDEPSMVEIKHGGTDASN